ncbi:MAG TPA: dolichyl-phosphate beta-glucosyltransferase [Planctomycetota bacterium]
MSLNVLDAPPRPSRGLLDGRSLSVVIPAYNEERRLPATLARVRAFAASAGLDVEILVVDDGSRDGTREAVLRAAADAPEIRLLTYGGNRGKGYAVRAGVLQARREAVLFSDADLSTPIEELRALWPRLDQGCDIAIASRKMSRSRITVRQPWPRQVAGRVFNTVISTIGVRGFRDTQCGFKLFKAPVARRIFSALKTSGFAFDVEVLLRARRLGLQVAEVPVRWENSGDSRVSFVRDSLRMLREVLKMRTWL